jgi:hypothetical protein
MNTRRFMSAASYSPEHRRGHRHQSMRSLPIRGVVYPRVLSRQRRAARQLCFVVDNARKQKLTKIIKLSKHNTQFIGNLLRNNMMVLLDFRFNHFWECIFGIFLKKPSVLEWSNLFSSIVLLFGNYSMRL